MYKYSFRHKGPFRLLKYTLYFSSKLNTNIHFHLKKKNLN